MCQSDVHHKELPLYAKACQHNLIMPSSFIQWKICDYNVSVLLMFLNFSLGRSCCRDDLKQANSSSKPIDVTRYSYYHTVPLPRPTISSILWQPPKLYLPNDYWSMLIWNRTHVIYMSSSFIYIAFHHNSMSRRTSQKQAYLDLTNQSITEQMR